MGTLLFVILVILVLAALVGAGGYSVRRYWSPAGSEVVETDYMTTGAGPGIAAAILALFVLLLLFLGFTQWHWFGTTGATTAPSHSTTVSSPAPSGGTTTSPAATASPSSAP